MLLSLRLWHMASLKALMKPSSFSASATASLVTLSSAFRRSWSCDAEMAALVRVESISAMNPSSLRASATASFTTPSTPLRNSRSLEASTAAPARVVIMSDTKPSSLNAWFTASFITLKRPSRTPGSLQAEMAPLLRVQTISVCSSSLPSDSQKASLSAALKWLLVIAFRIASLTVANSWSNRCPSLRSAMERASTSDRCPAAALLASSSTGTAAAEKKAPRKISTATPRSGAYQA
mmetsp:Transcript_49556/g.114845  ORF Transcript_49556/g.114845 Transcript_49556/m.114845 type:complete len:236 (-) Transcript_49556:68-775(-)